jgi:hypothetical protein
VNTLTLPDLIDTLVAARRAGGFRYHSQQRVLRQFAEHARREGHADGSIIKETVEDFLYGRHLKASTIRREEIVLRELAEHVRQFGWQAWAPATLTGVKTPHRPPPYVFSDDEIRRLFHVIDTQQLSEMSNRALVDPVLFRVFYATGMLPHRAPRGGNHLERDSLVHRSREPDKTTWPLTTGQFRRTLAWHIAHQPFGVVAGARQYKHAHIAVFEGYAGTSTSGFAAEVAAEQVIAQLDYVEDLYRGWLHDNRSGGGANAGINAEFERIRHELADLPGTIADRRRG